MDDIREIDESPRGEVTLDGRLIWNWGPSGWQFEEGEKKSWVADFPDIDSAAAAGQKHAEGTLAPNLHSALTTIRAAEVTPGGAAVLTVRWNIEGLKT